jgi:hypothetical protein
LFATEELADVLADLKSRTVDWKGVDLEQLGRLMQYDPLVGILINRGGFVVSSAPSSTPVAAVYFSFSRQ